MKRNRIWLSLAVTAAMCFISAPANAAIWTLYFDRALFLAALGGPPSGTQDFQGLAAGTNLDGVDFLPAVNVTSNAADVEVFNSLGDHSLFAFDGVTRDIGNLYYDIHAGNLYRAIGFDIDAYNPAEGPGLMEVFFQDGASTSQGIFPTNATEDDPLFFGVIADVAVDHIVWHEGLESGGGNEETALDDFVVGQPIPEPATMLLLGSGLLGLGAASRRRKK